MRAPEKPSRLLMTHLLVAGLVLLGQKLYLEHRGDSDFGDALFVCGFGAGIFSGLQLTLDVNMIAFLEDGCGLCHAVEGHAAMPFCARFPFAALCIFP